MAKYDAIYEGRLPSAVRVHINMKNNINNHLVIEHVKALIVSVLTIIRK